MKIYHHKTLIQGLKLFIEEYFEILMEPMNMKIT